MAALIHLPKTAKPGEVISIRTLQSHPMDSGYNRDDAGRPVERNIIRWFTCLYDGEEVFRMELSPAISANPFIIFTTVATQSGTLTFIWADEKGQTWRETTSITVAA